MAINNGNGFSCTRNEEMLAYLYDELSPKAREEFEAHMEGCLECIDEFAELAVSRYSVFEWKSVEFAPLATPKFVIPTEKMPSTASWFDSVRAAFAWNGWALAGGAAAVLLFAIAGIELWNVRPDATIAGIEAVPADETAPSAESRSERPAKNAELDQAGRATSEAEKKPAVQARVPAAQSSRIRGGNTKAVTVRKAAAKPTAAVRAAADQRLQNSPTLGQYVEDRDDSLRLTDIFDDLGTRDME